MRQIVNGRLYDTEKAELIGSFYSNTILPPRRHFLDLYRTDDGVYFLYKQVAKMLDDEEYVFIRCDGSNCRDGLGLIIPISASRAREWAEENLQVDEYLKAFALNTDRPDFDDEAPEAWEL